MKQRVTLRTAINVTKYAIAPIASWPLPRGASRLNVALHNFCWWFSIIHTISNSYGWFYNVYSHSGDPDVMIRALSEIGALYSTIFKMLICKIEAPRLQYLIAEMQEFLDEANDEELELIQQYVDKCLPSHTTVLVSCMLGPIAYILGPLLISQPLPGAADYPFSLEPTWIWMILYASHSVIIAQVGCMAILDFMFAILLWYAGARFEMLGLEFQRATTPSDVQRCIRKHQDLIKYVDKLKLATRYMALEVTTIAVFAVTTGGFVLIRNPPAYIVAKYVFFELVSALELFLFTWPADNLIDKTEKIGYAAYGCAWEGKPPGMLQDLLIVMLRAKSPAVIAIDGLLPILSLELYGSTLSASFSYLTTLRAVAAT